VSIPLFESESQQDTAWLVDYLLDEQKSLSFVERFSSYHQSTASSAMPAEHSAHNVPFEEPQRFLETLVRELAPKANAPATRDGASYVPSTSASLRSRKLRSAPVPTRSSARR
jgi:hypothetical protein